MKESSCIEITSAGSLPDMLSKEEFFEGFSMPRNQEMMRIFKDLDLVEHLGSGIPRILEAYSSDCFRFTENFLRMTFPNAWDLSEDEDVAMPEGVENNATPHATPHVTPHVTDHVGRLLSVMEKEHTRNEIQQLLDLQDRKSFRTLYLHEALKLDLIEMMPDKPKSIKQKYRLTDKGKALQKELKK